ncbi:MAG: cysteine synthase CysM [Gammaproteobacteria bacterium]|nr:cysteine synthase CysM [Gammaproteobacteria bacterium]
MSKQWQHIEDLIGNTPLVALRKIKAGKNNEILLKMEMQNPSASVKARAAFNLIDTSEKAGLLKPGVRLVEATSGNTGIALAMVAAIKGYKMTLVMPSNNTQERKDLMRAYGAELIEVDAEQGMERARDLAEKLSKEPNSLRLDQFADPANPDMHYKSTAPEIWQQTDGKLTHFISSMGTTGTITGCSRFFKEKNSDIKVVGLQPEDGVSIPGIRKWPPEYVPEFFTDKFIDEIVDMKEQDAIDMTKRLAKEEGILCGISSGATVKAALDQAEQTEGALIVAIICDSGERYVSTGIFQD